MAQKWVRHTIAVLGSVRKSPTFCPLLLMGPWHYKNALLLCRWLYQWLPDFQPGQALQAGKEEGG